MHLGIYQSQPRKKKNKTVNSKGKKDKKKKRNRGSSGPKLNIPHLIIQPRTHLSDSILAISRKPCVRHQTSERRVTCQWPAILCSQSWRWSKQEARSWHKNINRLLAVTSIEGRRAFAIIALLAPLRWRGGLGQRRRRTHRLSCGGLIRILRYLGRAEDTRRRLAKSLRHDGRRSCCAPRTTGSKQSCCTQAGCWGSISLRAVVGAGTS